MAATADRCGGAGRPAQGSSIAQSPFEPASAAALPTVVPKKELIRRWFARAGVPLPRGAAAHAFRHTMAMQLVGRGKAVNEVQALLGPASLSSTQIYIRAAGHQVGEAAHALPVRGVLREIRQDTTSG